MIEDDSVFLKTTLIAFRKLFCYFKQKLLLQIKCSASWKQLLLHRNETFLTTWNLKQKYPERFVRSGICFYIVGNRIYLHSGQ